MEDLTGVGKTADAGAKVTIALLDKIEGVCGWIATPRGKRKDRIEAKNNFVESIKSNVSLNELEKAAFISNAGKIIREYENQNDICQMAIKQLSSTARPEEIKKDWLSRFFDSAKYVYDDDIKPLWARILANECQEPGTISSSLFQKISSLNSKTANVFNLIGACTFCLEHPFPVPFIDWRGNQSFYIDLGITFYLLSELSSIGLIQFDSSMSFVFRQESLMISYKSSMYSISSPTKEIEIGNVLLTADGVSLMKAIDAPRIPDIESNFLKFAENKKYSITPVPMKIEEIK